MATKAEVEKELAEACEQIEQLSKIAAQLGDELDAASDENEMLRSGGGEPLSPAAGVVAGLSAPFPEEEIGKLPREGCYDCATLRRNGGKPWDGCNRHENTYATCDECGAKHTGGAIHLSFIGHADLTHRLLLTDPGWFWEPAGVNADGTPVIVVNGRKATMWIKLHVQGRPKPMLGVGTADAGKDDVEKELIGDALRNAAMRLGAGLDLWAKGDRAWATGADAGADVAEPEVQQVPKTVAPDPTVELVSERQVGALKELVDAVPEAARMAIVAEIGKRWGKPVNIPAADFPEAMALVADIGNRPAPETDEGAVERLREAGLLTKGMPAPASEPDGHVPEEDLTLRQGIKALTQMQRQVTGVSAHAAVAELKELQLIPLTGLTTMDQVETAKGILAKHGATEEEGF